MKTKVDVSLAHKGKWFNDVLKECENIPDGNIVVLGDDAPPSLDNCWDDGLVPNGNKDRCIPCGSDRYFSMSDEGEGSCVDYPDGYGFFADELTDCWGVYNRYVRINQNINDPKRECRLCPVQDSDTFVNRAVNRNSLDSGDPASACQILRPGYRVSNDGNSTVSCSNQRTAVSDDKFSCEACDSAANEFYNPGELICTTCDANERLIQGNDSNYACGEIPADHIIGQDLTLEHCQDGLVPNPNKDACNACPDAYIYRSESEIDGQCAATSVLEENILLHKVEGADRYKSCEEGSVRNKDNENECIPKPIIYCNPTHFNVSDYSISWVPGDNEILNVPTYEDGTPICEACDNDTSIIGFSFAGLFCHDLATNPGTIYSWEPERGLFGISTVIIMKSLLIIIPDAMNVRLD